MKIFGIGMSKTGTSTLSRCFKILNQTPIIGNRSDLKDIVRSDRPYYSINKKFDYDYLNPIINETSFTKVIDVAKSYKCFHDSPWYMIFRRLDESFPGSKFILTIRKDSITQAKSDWYHNQRKGRVSGEPTKEFLKKQIEVYENHNNAVIDYFSGRPNNLLVVCWENGDGWEKICNFLRLEIPTSPFPHENSSQEQIFSLGNIRKFLGNYLSKNK